MYIIHIGSHKKYGNSNIDVKYCIFHGNKSDACNTYLQTLYLVYRVTELQSLS